jgi:NAD(P)-dependent dehydrogenase (short-subunit alcohol dehydrogenase family)
MQLEGKVALVTGGGSGIGAAAAKLLAEEGARVGILARSKSEINVVCQDIESKGGTAIPLVADISKPVEMKAAVQELISQWNRLNIVFANAGINGVWASLEELEPGEWDQTLEINLKGTFLTVKYALPHLKKQGGSIIITSSVNGTRMFSNTGATAYACSKAAQVAFTKMIAVELGEYKIRANAICPGWIETDIEENTEERETDDLGIQVEYPEGSIPLTAGTPGSPEQVAQLVLFLASDASDHISGTEVWIDGAQSLLQG